MFSCQLSSEKKEKKNICLPNQCDLPVFHNSLVNMGNADNRNLQSKYEKNESPIRAKTAITEYSKSNNIINFFSSCSVIIPYP